MKYAYPVTTPECSKPVMAYMTGYETVFSKLHSLGYGGVELLLRDPGMVRTDELDEALEKNQLQIAAIGTSPMQVEEKLFLLHPDADNRREARRRCSGLLGLCSRYHAPALIGKYRGQVLDDPHCTRRDLETVIRDICDEAAALDVEVLLEPQNASNINNLNTIEESLAWIQKIGYGRLGLLADIYHMGITEENILDSLKKALPKLGLIHMADSDRKIPGMGALPIRKIMEFLREQEYGRFISMEIKQLPCSGIAAGESIGYLSACMGGK